MIVWSFKILITIVLALIYSFCFRNTVPLLIPIKRHDFCQTPLYNQRRTLPFLSRGAVLIYFLLLLGGGDDTSENVIVTLSNLWGVNSQLGTVLKIAELQGLKIEQFPIHML